MDCDSGGMADGPGARFGAEEDTLEPRHSSAPPSQAVEVLVVGQRGVSFPTTERTMNHEETRIGDRNPNSGPVQISSFSRIHHLDSQQSAHASQEPHRTQYHQPLGTRNSASDANSEAMKLNRRSQSVTDRFIGRSNSTRGRLASANFLARTRSLGSWMATQTQVDEGQNPAKDPFNHRPSRSSWKATKVHAVLDSVPNDSRPEVQIEIPAAARSELGTGDSADGDDGGREHGHGGNSKDGAGTVPEQSPIEQVALVVPITDDTSLPVWTFRVWTLGITSSALLTFLNTYFSYRNEPIVLGVTTALIVSFPLGRFMAAVLPNKFVRLPGTRYGFSLNPGEFSTKEHSLIIQFAGAGALRPGGLNVVTLVKIFFKGTIEFFPSFVFTLTCELMALCWGGMLQKFLVEPASMWWPSSLVNVSLVKALHSESEEKGKGMSRLQFFLVCLMAAFAYHVLPGYLFPTLSGISVLCYVFKHNTLAQQLGSGRRGLGIGAFSLNYATIISYLGSPMVVPSIAVFNIIVGLIVQTYIFVPITYWRNYYKAQNFPIFSSSLYTSGGQSYNVSRILTSSNHGNFKFNHAGYDTEGPTYFSTFYAVTTGLTFTLFGCLISQALVFNGGDLWRIMKSTIAKEQVEPDVHTRLIRKYPRVTAKCSFALLLALNVISCINVEVYKKQLQMKWWGVLLGTCIIAMLVFPVCILMATTNQLVNLAVMAQYLMGYIRPGEPVTSGVFRSYSTVVCGRVANYLSNYKFCHYMKVPPRASFWGQAVGTVVATLVSLGVTWWLTSTVDNICDTARLPRNTPWTCPADRIFFDQAVTWGLVGPEKLFAKGGPYNSLNYYFLPGMLLPIILWVLRWAFPQAVWLTYVNLPLIVRGAWPMPPSAVVNNTTWLAIALVFSVYVFTYKKRWWQRYNYVLAAALDTGTVVMAVLLYYSMNEGKESLHWWGKSENGDHCPLATCPIAIPKPGCHGY